MATLKDIAEVAGVTVDTVSRALNRKGKEKWPSSLRRAEKIRKLAIDLGYFPNAAARAVKTGRFGQIACVISEYQWYLDRPGLAGNLRYPGAVTEYLAERGYSTFVEPYYVDLKTEEFVGVSRLFSEIAVDGIIAVEMCGSSSPQVDQRICDMGVPVVWLNRACGSGIPSVRCDETVGANLLVDHLVELGHRRIAYLGSHGQHYSCRTRSEGVINALQRHGLDASNIIFGSWKPTVDVVSMQLLKSDPRPTAIICYNRSRYDLLLHQACSLGIRVPDDLSLCCFAEIREAQAAGYPITSAVIPEDEISKVGVECLLDQIELGKAPGEFSPVAPTLQVGATTKPPSTST